jgi:hypothetical protein
MLHRKSLHEKDPVKDIGAKSISQVHRPQDAAMFPKV